VGDVTFESPSVHVNLLQLREESRDEVPFKQRGWQDVLEAAYPLKMNELRIENGALVYRDDSGFKPLHASQVDVRALNIRNVFSGEREYPSSVRIAGAVFDVGAVVVDGHADFMAKPIPGLKARIEVDQVELSYFQPVLRRYGLTVNGGFLRGGGMCEIGSAVRIFDLESVVISDASIDYEHGVQVAENVRQAAETIGDTAREAMNDPETLFRVRRLAMDGATIGFVNHTTDPVYRVFVSDGRFVLENLSSRAEDGVGRAALTGTLMGTGKVDAQASFFPEGKNANFEAKLSIAETKLAPLNDLLRAHGNFDVVRGGFSLYTEVRVQDGRIDGYIKPMFREIDVYDKAQDKKKNVFRKMYEGIVGGVANLLENRRRDEVATVAKIEGPVGNPDSSTLEIIGHLIRNAFFDAILPGFEREVKLVDPVQYRAAQRAEKKGSS
jgi:hypothetical protein